MLTFILLVFALLLTVFYLWYKINFNYWTRYPQIPSVKGSIFSGDFKDFLTFKTNFGFHLQTIYENEKFQNAAVVGIYGLYKPALLIREPALIKSVFIKDFDLFRNRPCQGGSYDTLGSLNFYFARYPYWKKIRSKLVPVFSSGKLKLMYPLIQKVGNNLEDYLNKQPDCFKTELISLCGRYTVDVLSTTILGSCCNALENPLEIMYTETLKMVHFTFQRALQLLIVFFAPKLNPLFRPRIFYESTEAFMRSSIKQMMAEREKTGLTRNDLIDAFVKIKQEAEIKGENVSATIEGLIAQACFLILAAYDASDRTISLTLLQLAKHQEMQKRLREEILTAFCHENGEISYDALNKLEYLEMFVNEINRLYPALPIFERLHELHSEKSSGFNLKPHYDYDLPHEMPVYVSGIALHYDPKYWPNPTKFDPERFNPTNKKLITPMTFLPFGAGPHMCLGLRMGMLIIKIAVVNFLKNHYVRICAETITEPEFEPKAVMLQTKGGVHLEFIRDNLYLNKENKTI